MPAPDWKIIPITTSGTYVTVNPPLVDETGDVSMYTEDGAPVKFAKDATGTESRDALIGGVSESWNDICVDYGKDSIMYVQGTTPTNLIVLFKS